VHRLLGKLFSHGHATKPERCHQSPWPPRSPDLTPMDFYSGGFLKDTVYREKLQNVSEIHDRSVRAAE